jgi:hypothetical protein
MQNFWQSHGKWNIPEGAVIRREYAPLVGAMPGQVPTPSSLYPYGVTASQPIIPDEFPPPNMVFDKKQKKKKPKLNEGGKMKSFLQFLELMEANKKNELPKPMAKADQQYRAFSEKKDKKGKNLKME